MLGCRCARKTDPPMIRPRTALLVLVPALLHALAREVDRGLGLVLRAEIEADGLLSEVARAASADGLASAGRVGLWLVAGIGAWLALAWWEKREGRASWDEALRRQAVVFAPLLLRPAMSALALALGGGSPVLPLRLHPPRRADAGLGDRPGRRGARGDPRPAPPGPPFPGPARRRGVRPRLPGLRRPRPRVGVAVGGAPGQRAQVPPPGGGAGPRPHLRRRGRERDDGGAAGAVARRVAPGGGGDPGA